MGNSTSTQQDPKTTTSTPTFSTHVTLQLEKSESDLMPGDVVSGNLALECCEMTNGKNGKNAANSSQALFYARYEGIMVTVTGVEYAVSCPGILEEQELVVTDQYKLGRFIEFPKQQQQQQQNNNNEMTEDQEQDEQDASSSSSTTRKVISMEHPFEIELPQASPEIEIDMDDFINNLHHAQQPQHHRDDDDAPDAVSLHSSCDSSCDDDDDDDRQWEMLSSTSDKRHSLSSEPNSTKVRKQYAYKVKAVLKPRQPVGEPQAAQQR